MKISCLILSFALIIGNQLHSQIDEENYLVHIDQIAWSMDDIFYHLSNSNLGIWDIGITRVFDKHGFGYYQEEFFDKSKWQTITPIYSIKEFYLTKQDLYLGIKFYSSMKRNKYGELKLNGEDVNFLWVKIKNFKKGYFPEKPLKIKIGHSKKVKQSKIILDHKILSKMIEKQFPDLQEYTFTNFFLASKSYGYDYKDWIKINISKGNDLESREAFNLFYLAFDYSFNEEAEKWESRFYKETISNE